MESRLGQGKASTRPNMRIPPASAIIPTTKQRPILSGEHNNDDGQAADAPAVGHPLRFPSHTLGMARNQWRNSDQDHTELNEIQIFVIAVLFMMGEEGRRRRRRRKGRGRKGEKE